MDAENTEVTNAIPKSLFTLQVSPNGRYFVDPAGKPVFFLGDTQWELFRLYTPERALALLNNRKAKAFNVILVMLTGVDLSRLFPNRPASFANIKGDLPWLGSDPLRPNEDYFKHVDPIIRLGEQTGQTLIVGVYHQWHDKLIPLSKARPWARWVARRYKDVPNLIWSMYPQATEAYKPVCRELAAGLLEGDGGAHLISIHPDPSVASSSFMHEEEWLAFNMIQTCVTFDQIADTVQADYERTPTRPVVMAEGGYEGLEFDRLQTPHDIRKQAYWSLLAGGHHVYGHNEAWLHPLDWGRWMDAPGASQLRIMKELCEALPDWWNLLPDDSIILSGGSEGYRLNLAARSSEGNWLLAYLSEPSTLRLRLDVLSGPECRAIWIDPRSGRRMQAGIFKTSDMPAFSTPRGWEDAVLQIAIRGSTAPLNLPQVGKG